MTVVFASVEDHSFLQVPSWTWAQLLFPPFAEYILDTTLYNKCVMDFSSALQLVLPGSCSRKQFSRLSFQP